VGPSALLLGAALQYYHQHLPTQLRQLELARDQMSRQARENQVLAPTTHPHRTCSSSNHLLFAVWYLHEPRLLSQQSAMRVLLSFGEQGHVFQILPSKKWCHRCAHQRASRARLTLTLTPTTDYY
jgi:hypothetical protein